MNSLVKALAVAAICAPTAGFAVGESPANAPITVAVSEKLTPFVGLPALGIPTANLPQGSSGQPVAADAAQPKLPVASVIPFDAAVQARFPDAGGQGLSRLEAASRLGDAKAQVELGVKYAHAEGVPKDQHKANTLFCSAAKYGDADGLYNLGWAYANGRGVARDDGVAALLFRLAAERGHLQAPRLLNVVVHEINGTQAPACMRPESLPVAALPPAPPVAEDVAEPRIPMAPKEIAQLVNRLAPQFEVDANLVLAVIYAESAFNPQALSSARAQGLMQLIPETAERFGVKQPFNPDENIKGGLAYLRWLLAYFQGDVQLVLAAYNAGEGAVEKFKGIPPYNETRDYVKKIIGMYRRLAHPYNPGVVKPSPLIAQLRSVL